MGSLQRGHSPEYYRRQILRSTFFANGISLEPNNSSDMLVVDCNYWILVLCWW